MAGIERTMLVLSVMFVFTSLGIYFSYRSETLFNGLKISGFVRNGFVVSVVCFCFYMALLPFYPCYNGFDTLSQFFVAVASHFLRSVFFVFTPVWLILYLQRLLEVKNVGLVKQHVVIIASIFICLISTNIWMRLLIDDSHANTTIQWTFLLSLFFSGIVSGLYLTISYTKLAQKKQQYQRELEISRLNELKTKAELEALQAKINPHFLYNTLNSIAELSVSQGLKARQMTIAMADIFRYSLSRNNETEITIAEEIEMVENYLVIEKLRFEDKLEVAIVVDEDVKRLPIPKFILQPIVENAVKHGLKGLNEKGFIKITAMRSKNQLNIIVHDNGAPFPADMGIGFGLKNVMDKLSSYYHEKQAINFENEPVKQVSISITL